MAIQNIDNLISTPDGDQSWGDDLRGAMETIKTAIGELDDTGWIAPTLNSPYTDWGGGWYARYRRLNGVTYMAGLVDRNAAATNTIVFTLPAGFRPSANLMFIVQADDGRIRLDVYPNGDIRVQDEGSIGLTGNWVSLSCSFPADA